MVLDLYNNIYNVLVNDLDVLSYLGIGTTADDLTKAERVQKRAKPSNLVGNNMPLIAFYSLNGRRNLDNLVVYKASFVFDIYTHDNVEVAHKLGDRILKLFDRQLLPMRGIESFESYFVKGFERNVDVEDKYCFTVVIDFPVTLED